MIGVFSLWTGNSWFKLTRDMAMLASAAIAYGKRSMLDIELVTDGGGMRIADRLGWDATSYRLDLEDVCPATSRHIWMLGKIIAQMIQEKPFVHIDLDLILFEPLPARLTISEVFAQSKDNLDAYLSDDIGNITEAAGMPRYTVPYNTALIGWNNLLLKDHYCRVSLEMAERVSAWKNGGACSIVCEQTLLGWLCRQHRVKIAEAIPMPVHASNGDFEDVKFSHFWGRSKADEVSLRKLEERFRDDFRDEHLRFYRGWDKGRPASLT